MDKLFSLVLSKLSFPDVLNFAMSDFGIAKSQLPKTLGIPRNVLHLILEGTCITFAPALYSQLIDMMPVLNEEIIDKSNKNAMQEAPSSGELKALREQAGLSENNVAELLRKSPRYIKGHERGSFDPYIARFLQALYSVFIDSSPITLSATRLKQNASILDLAYKASAAKNGVGIDMLFEWEWWNCVPLQYVSFASDLYGVPAERIPVKASNYNIKRFSLFMSDLGLSDSALENYLGITRHKYNRKCKEDKFIPPFAGMKKLVEQNNRTIDMFFSFESPKIAVNRERLEFIRCVEKRMSIPEFCAKFQITPQEFRNGVISSRSITCFRRDYLASSGNDIPQQEYIRLLSSPLTDKENALICRNFSAAKFRSRFTEKQCTKEFFLNRTRLKKDTFYRLFNGNHKPSFDTLDAVANFFDADVFDFIDY